MNILVTGGTGYIGSHTIVELLTGGHEVVAVDNLSNSQAKVLERIKTITGKDVPFYELDVADYQKLSDVFEKHTFDAVIHFAALKAPAVSAKEPILYYQNNLDSNLTLAKVMHEHDVKQLVFSSSAAVYGAPASVPIDESAPALSATNPYGQTKVMCERIWQDIALSDASWNITLLRYFNPIGAHESGLIGEDPNGPPNNLVPYISQVAVGRREHLNVYGDDYETPDGTGVRDYIHVVDLAKGHVAALSKKQSGTAGVYNLGTGTGYSVFETIAAFEEACGKKVPYKIMPRRDGDIATCYSNASKAAKELGWKAEKSLSQMCEDAWRWQSMNPDGFQ
jgi:UDP-glucose 4-epimerase